MRKCQWQLPRHIEPLMLKQQSKTHAIWQVWDKKRQQHLAWKMPMQKTSSTGIEACILQEAIHPRIPYFAETVSNGFLMEWIYGDNLYEARQKTQAWSARQCVVYGCQMLEILCALHHHGYVHLDIKPQNFMIDSYHNIYLIDFGSAHKRNEMVTVFYGTPFYASPNMHRENHAKTRFDLYAFAKTMLVLCQKQIPTTHRQEKIDLSFPAVIHRICMACLKEEVDDSTLVYEAFLFADLRQKEIWRSVCRRYCFFLQLFLTGVMELFL